MATLGNAARVGLVALVAAALTSGTYVFLRGAIVGEHTYSFDVLFDDARGVTAETPVTLAGVQIGKVESVRLTEAQKADLRLQIKDSLNGQPVRIPAGSRFTIATPLLGQSGTLVVVPPVDSARLPAIHQGEILKGDQSADITASFSKATALLDQVTQTTRKVDRLLDSANKLAGDPRLQNGLVQTVGNLDAASANGLKLTGKLNGLLLDDNAQVKALLTQTGAGEQVSLNNIAETTASIRDTTRENRGQIAAIVRNLSDTTSAFAGITGQANQILKGGNLQATVASLKTTTDNLAATTAKFNAIAGNFESLSADPTVQGNLRETLENIKESSGQATLLLERLNKLAGVKPKKTAAVIVAPGGGGAVILPGANLPTPTPAPALGAPYYLPRVDFVVNTRTHHFRTDVDTIVPLSVAPVSFVRAGLYGATESNKLILQAGRGVGRSGLVDGRVGLYASQLSVGGDIGLGRAETLSFDLYDPNNYHLDAHGVIKLAPELGLIVGGEDLTRHPGGLVGLEYRQSR